MLVLSETVKDDKEGRTLVQKALDEGKALERFRALVSAQGGDVNYVDNPELLPSAAYVETCYAERSGWVQQVHARNIGETAVALGAGRSKKGDPIDHAVGIQVYVKVGERVDAGDPLFAIHAANQESLESALQSVKAAVALGEDPVDPHPLVYGVVK
jgi:pyrimidine-nucleoside phosphorylase